MTFRYEGHDRMGSPLRGELEAESVEAAAAALRDKGIYTMNLEPTTEEPMKTVLEHKDTPVESPTVDPGVTPAMAAMRNNSALEDPPTMVGDLKDPARLHGETEIGEEVRMAVGVAKEIKEALIALSSPSACALGALERAEGVEDSCLREILAEVAVRRFRNAAWSQSTRKL